MSLVPLPTTAYPAVVVIDADEDRGQRMARLLTLAHARPLVATTPFQAYERIVREQMAFQCVVLGAYADKQRFLLQQLAQRYREAMGYDPPLAIMPTQVVSEGILVADAARSTTRHSVSYGALIALESVWQAAPALRQAVQPDQPAPLLDRLAAFQMQPHVARIQRSRNSHFRHLLQAAYDLLGQQSFEVALTDVGLARYIRPADWPPDDDALEIPADYPSYLNQAMVFAQPANPRELLTRWSAAATQVSFRQRAYLALTQQALKLLPRDTVMSSTLSAFTRTMNDIRGEDLHTWAKLPDGCYAILHSSNLYAYGRLRQSAPQCAVWVASLEATLRLVGQHTNWRVTEDECSCQTLSGHCVFMLRPTES